MIENEFGEIGIDGDRIQEDIPVREIFAGCICCSLAMDFRKGIKEIAENFYPDRILIEPSGSRAANGYCQGLPDGKGKRESQPADYKVDCNRGHGIL
ncbi:MAG: GTP-binding protein [[Clostridium] scindens]